MAHSSSFIPQGSRSHRGKLRKSTCPPAVRHCRLGSIPDARADQKGVVGGIVCGVGKVIVDESSRHPAGLEPPTRSQIRRPPLPSEEQPVIVLGHHGVGTVIPADYPLIAADPAGHIRLGRPMALWQASAERGGSRGCNSRDWPGWMRRSLRGAEELRIHAQGRVFLVGADRP